MSLDIPDALPSQYLPGDSVAIFTTPSTVTNVEWHTWIKPKGVTMVQIFCVGGGGGGGGGFTGLAGTPRGGGGGGGGSAHARYIGPAHLLPDMLYVQVGAGGAGNLSGGGTAGSGVASFVAVYPSNNAIDLVVYSSNTLPTGGAAGTVAAGGAGGGAGSIVVAANCHMAAHGQLIGLAGQAGTPGGAVAGATGTDLALPVGGQVCMGGTGGGGVTAAALAGGAITAATTSFLSERIPAVSAAGGSPAGSAQLWKPFFSYSGMGGASVNGAAGLEGGNGAIGSGGGGGGGGTTGGKGGDGGGGIVIVTCW